MPNCRSNVIGIKIVYCDSTGEQNEVWVDLNRVRALAWCEEQVGSKPAGKGGNGKLPEDPNGPGPCPDIRDDEPKICWWNGTEWVCGEE